MKSNKEREQLRDLAEAVGNFIRYWGFRRVHGQLWAVIFVSARSLNGTELAERLDVTKGLVSPALRELEEVGLIYVSGGDDKTKTYSANPDVFAVIRKVIRSRERVLIRDAHDAFARLRAGSGNGLDEARMDELGQMIGTAGVIVEAISHLRSQRDWAGAADLLVD